MTGSCLCHTGTVPLTGTITPLNEASSHSVASVSTTAHSLVWSCPICNWYAPGWFSEGMKAVFEHARSHFDKPQQQTNITVDPGGLSESGVTINIPGSPSITIKKGNS